ncbi:MAG: hypothetical protein KAR20_05610 [Candidatus Heimdallarchaeota archaeon]|nr:hypothetical protein [Candidatus Heimdallarchaeota archaeon]
MKLDHQVRYAGVYNTKSGKVFEKMGKGRDRMLNPEQTKNSLIHAYMRWKLRQQFADAVGKPVYAMTKYEKINRMTMPCGKNALLRVSMQSNIEPQTILPDVLKLIEKFGDKEYATNLNYQMNF